MPIEPDLTRFWRVLDNVLEGPTVVKSIRVPVKLHEAMQIAVELGLADNVNEAFVRGGVSDLEMFAQRLALELHYAQHPHARPSLAEVALAMARLDADPLAECPELIDQAAEEVATIRSNPTPEDVLLYAAALASKRAS